MSETKAGKTEQFETIRLNARVLAGGSRSHLVAQADACVMLDVSDQSMRNYEARGMPVQRERPDRPLYNLRDVIAWYRAFRGLARRGDRPPAHLSLEEAIEWNLRSDAREHPGEFVTVPLDHDHPLRARQLRAAAAGRAPDKPLTPED